MPHGRGDCRREKTDRPMNDVAKSDESGIQNVGGALRGADA